VLVLVYILLRNVGWVHMAWHCAEVYVSAYGEYFRVIRISFEHYYVAALYPILPKINCRKILPRSFRYASRFISNKKTTWLSVEHFLKAPILEYPKLNIINIPLYWAPWRIFRCWKLLCSIWPSWPIEVPVGIHSNCFMESKLYWPSKWSVLLFYFKSDISVVLVC